MDHHNEPLDRKEFFKRIMAIELGILLLSAILSLALRINFSVILFGLGLTMLGIGVFLSPPRMSRSPSFRRRHEKLPPQVVHDLQSSLPDFALENAIFYAGLIAMVLSLPFICQIMF